MPHLTWNDPPSQESLNSCLLYQYIFVLFFFFLFFLGGGGGSVNHGDGDTVSVNHNKYEM